MNEPIIQIITAAIGTLGFSIYFRVNERNVFAATLGGAMGWAIYLLIFHFTEHLFFANFIAALMVYLYAEAAARILKAPANIYLISGIIPLLPGNALYYTMRGVVDGNSEMFSGYLSDTLAITFGIAAGIVVGTVLITYYIKLSEMRKRKKQIKDTTKKP